MALKWVLPESDAARAIRLRDDFRHGIHELLSPDFFPVEVAHNLSKSERRGIILPGDGTTKLADVLAFMPALFPSLPLLPKAFQISSQA
nr:type II toxin-antitoxin system VapC family toxin [Gemmatimonadota bacterium]